MQGLRLRRIPRGANWLLIIYLSVVLSGCSFRPAELSPEEAQVLQTHEFNRSAEDVARAAVLVLQELHYSLGNVDMGLGVITAERTSKFRLAPMSRENPWKSDISDEVKTFCLVAGTFAVIGIVLGWMFDGSEDEEDNDSYSSHSEYSHSSPIYGSAHDMGADSYRYSMTITLQETSLQQTRVRVTVQGQHLEGMSVLESGPVQDQEFYADFFNRLNRILNY